MKISSGKFRGRKIFSISGVYTRPTSNKLKKNIFNLVSCKIKNAKVLDLFAGSGSMGIEAFSMGAKYVVFIDFWKKSIDKIRTNLRILELDSYACVFKWDILNNLNCLSKIGVYFDIIFIDPPYNKNIVGLVLNNIIKINILKYGSFVVIEHHIKDLIPKYANGLVLMSQKKYSEVVVSFFCYFVKV